MSDNPSQLSIPDLSGPERPTPLAITTVETSSQSGRQRHHATAASIGNQTV